MIFLLTLIKLTFLPFLFAKSYPTGNISKLMGELKEGDNICMRGPKGSFKYKRNMVKSIGMVAGKLDDTVHFYDYLPTLFAFTRRNRYYSDASSKNKQVKEEEIRCTKRYTIDHSTNPERSKRRYHRPFNICQSHRK
jgi:Na+-transporting NADH:ubiquinone oxidoreductase subunit NqrF